MRMIGNLIIGFVFIFVIAIIVIYAIDRLNPLDRITGAISRTAKGTKRKFETMEGPGGLSYPWKYF